MSQSSPVVLGVLFSGCQCVGGVVEPSPQCGLKTRLSPQKEPCEPLQPAPIATPAPDNHTPTLCL